MLTTARGFRAEEEADRSWPVTAAIAVVAAIDFADLDGYEGVVASHATSIHFKGWRNSEREK
jgi:hypothetical protein